MSWPDKAVKTHRGSEGPRDTQLASDQNVWSRDTKSMNTSVLSTITPVFPMVRSARPVFQSISPISQHSEEKLMHQEDSQREQHIKTRGRVLGMQLSWQRACLSRMKHRIGSLAMWWCMHTIPALVR